MEGKENYFAALNAVNVSDKTEKKNGLTYLSWAWAWGEVKKRHPDSTYTVYESPEGCLYHTDGKTCWVKTGVRVNGIEHIEYLPVMDNRNRSIPKESVTSTDANKAVQRSLTKAIARHGLGLYIYAGEDLPDEERGKGAEGPAAFGSGPSEDPDTAGLQAEVLARLEHRIDLANAASKKRYGKLFYELNVEELGEVLDKLAEKG